MNAAEWRRVRAVLEPALELPPADVHAWLAANCPPELRADVDALLAASAVSAFIDQPVAPHDMLLPPGATIGPYTIQYSIGAGGMGVVYRAEDPRLGRTVAIKLMPFSPRTPLLLAEARMISSLNHPNIVTLHDVVDHDGSLALVMEYVEGQTLAERIHDALGLPPTEALSYARQIASALAASHEAGLLHRDLKPSNVMIRPDGTVKVLDFGIAQSITDAASGDTRPAGTAGYMAPEQSAGQPLDARADIYAFGAVLRELLYGQATTPARKVPARWRALVDRCLSANPADRPASMRDVAAALEPERPRQLLLRSIAAVMGIAVVGAGVYATRRPSPAAYPPAYLAHLVAGTDAVRVSPRISPDGSTVVYAEVTTDGSALVSQGANAPTATPLRVDGRQPDWSPDGRRIVFRSEREGGGLFILDRETGQARAIGVAGFHPAWSPDGEALAYSTEMFDEVDRRPTANSQLWVVDLASGATRRVTNTDIKDAIQPAWSPDGRRLAFWSVDRGGQRDVWTVAASGGAAVRVTNDAAIDWSPAWSPDGWLYWSSNRGGTMNAWRVRVNTHTGVVANSPEAVQLPAAAAGFFSFSKTGVMAYAVTQPQSSIWKAEARADAVPSRVSPPAARVACPAVSPDGEWVAGCAQGERENLVLMRNDGTSFHELTTGAGRDTAPRWSPDGRTIAFGSNRGGAYQIWSVRPDGNDLKEVVRHKNGTFGPVWSPDGRRVAGFVRGFLPFVASLDSGEAQLLPPPVDNASGFRPGEWSADGERLLGVLRSTGGARLGLAVYSIASRRYTRIASGCDSFSVVWMPGGHAALCAAAQRFLVIDAATGASQALFRTHGRIDERFTISRDGRTIYFAQVEPSTEIWTAVPR